MNVSVLLRKMAPEHMIHCAPAKLMIMHRLESIPLGVSDVPPPETTYEVWCYQLVHGGPAVALLSPTTPLQLTVAKSVVRSVLRSCVRSFGRSCGQSLSR